MAANNKKGQAIQIAWLVFLFGCGGQYAGLQSDLMPLSSLNTSRFGSLTIQNASSSEQVVEKEGRIILSAITSLRPGVATEELTDTKVTIIYQSGSTPVFMPLDYNLESGWASLQYGDDIFIGMLTSESLSVLERFRERSNERSGESKANGSNLLNK